MNQKPGPKGLPTLGAVNEPPKSPKASKLQPLSGIKISPNESRNASQQKPSSGHALNKYSNDVLLSNPKHTPSNLAPLSPLRSNNASQAPHSIQIPSSQPEKKQAPLDLAPIHGGGAGGKKDNFSIANLEENQSLYEDSTQLDDHAQLGHHQRGAGERDGSGNDVNGGTRTVQFEEEVAEKATRAAHSKDPKVPKVLELDDSNGKPQVRQAHQQIASPQEDFDSAAVAFSRVLTNSGINIFSCSNPKHGQKLAKNVYVTYDPNKEQNKFKLGCTHCAEGFGGSTAKYEDFPEIISTLKEEIEKATSGNSKEYRVDDPFKDAKRAIVKQINSLIKECNFLAKYFDSQAKYLQNMLEERQANEKLAEARMKEQASKPDGRALKLLQLIDEFQNFNNLHDQQKYMEELGKNFIYSNQSNTLVYKTKANSDDVDDENLPQEQRKIVKECLDLSQQLENFINLLPEPDQKKAEKRNTDLEIQFASLLALEPAPSAPSTPGHSRQNSTSSSQKDPFLSVLKKSRFRLTEEDIQFIKTCLGPDYEGISLIFRASRDGFDNFHEFCDKKGPTLILMNGERNSQLAGSTGEDEEDGVNIDVHDNLSKMSQASADDKSKCIGAFTPLEWKCDGEYQVDEEKASFLFTFGTADRYQLELREERFAIRGFEESSGMLFGFGSGYDLAIAKENQFYQNSTNLGKSYQLPIIDGQSLSYGSTQAHNFLLGGNNFIIQNYQVYEVY